MTLSPQSKNLSLTKRASILSVSFSILLLGACANMAPAPQQAVQPPSLNAAAYEQFIQCKQEGLALDISAHQQQSPAQYAAAAKTLDQCLVEVDANRSAVPLEERMQVHALTVLDYLKGGDLIKAKLQLSAFELAYPNRDLYFSDYTSFVDSFRVLLGSDNDTNLTNSALNINAALQSDRNRHQYWQTH